MNDFRKCIERLRASLVVARGNPFLLWFPAALAGAGLLYVLAALGIAYVLYSALSGKSATVETIVIIVICAVIFLVIGLTSIFSTAMLFSAASTALEGESISVAATWKKVWANRRELLLWWLFQTGVLLVIGTIQSLLDKALGGMGKNVFRSVVSSIVPSLVGTAWSFATLFAIPIIMTHPDKPMAVLKKSAELFRSVWGQSATASVGFGLLGFLCLVAAGLLTSAINFMLFTFVPGIPSIVFPIVYALIAGPTLAAIIILVGSCQSVFNASLYRYADTGDYVGPFSQAMIAGAFVAK